MSFDRGILDRWEFAFDSMKVLSLDTTNQGRLRLLRNGIATGLLRIEFLEYMVNSELIQVIFSISGFYSYFAIVKSL